MLTAAYRRTIFSCAGHWPILLSGIFFKKVCEPFRLVSPAGGYFKYYDLDKRTMLRQNSNTYLFCWMGDRVIDTLVAMLRSKGIKAVNQGIAVSVANTLPDELQSCLRMLLVDGLPDVKELARNVINKSREKYDPFLTDELLNADYAASKLDAEGALITIRKLLN